ncbi:hypothetical protein POG23_17065, partial [Limnoraphis robusta]|nr:hypothetical protein [Limnoraphis robusta]
MIGATNFSPLLGKLDPVGAGSPSSSPPHRKTDQPALSKPGICSPPHRKTDQPALSKPGICSP